jgi:hypothetical protein
MSARNGVCAAQPSAIVSFPAHRPGNRHHGLQNSRPITRTLHRPVWTVGRETRSAKRFVADEKPGFPDRVELRDVDLGESVILVNYVHQPADTPFRASHAIFVREGAEHAYVAVNKIPDLLRLRPISVRAFNSSHWMIDADVCSDQQLDGVIQKFLSNPSVDYMQLHFAKRGCYAARVERA